MASNPVENTFQRRQTAAFIAADPDAVVIEREVKTSDGSGGFVTTRNALPVQVMRIVEPTGKAGSDFGIDGTHVTGRVRLVGRHDADIEKGDRFTWRFGKQYEVLEVSADRDYETRAEAQRL